MAHLISRYLGFDAKVLAISSLLLSPPDKTMILIFLHDLYQIHLINFVI